MLDTAWSSLCKQDLFLLVLVRLVFRIQVTLGLPTRSLHDILFRTPLLITTSLQVHHDAGAPECYRAEGVTNLFVINAKHTR